METALDRTTHLGIGAHPDDLEFMCWHPILHCFENPDCFFSGIIASDGRACPRTGKYANYSDDEMAELRLNEQRHAAVAGGYSAMVNLMYPEMGAVMEAEDPSALVKDLKLLILKTQPEFIATHNLADKHRHHILVSFCAIQALRELDYKPKQFLGCEVWRGLDWLPDDYKVTLDVSGHQNVTSSLMGIYDSQITGGKRYDLATAGRKKSNATYHDPYNPDQSELLEFAMDMMPLLEKPYIDPADYTRSQIGRFQDEVTRVLKDIQRSWM